ncbi:hypothetical protein ACIBAC_00785 [Streptomyces sp. NPDC051362]|uniref:hypothetical protein n=1 Tax=Streptomyces sp. NPDC051362 TaxID=3365651 RepID=UPI0037BA2A34
MIVLGTFLDFLSWTPLGIALRGLALWSLTNVVVAVVFVVCEGCGLLYFARHGKGPSYALAGWLVRTLARSHFVDVGRFTIGVWRRTRPGPAPLICGVAWMFHGKPYESPRAGVEFLMGRVTVGAFALMPRDDWARYQRAKAERKALRKALES